MLGFLKGDPMLNRGFMSLATCFASLLPYKIYQKFSVQGLKGLDLSSRMLESLKLPVLVSGVGSMAWLMLFTSFTMPLTMQRSVLVQR